MSSKEKGEPVVVIHGGAGRKIGSEEREGKIREALGEILEEVYELARGGAAAVEVVRRGCMLLEDCELFNAGKGSALQNDGQIRMSASVMDGDRRAFSGVINVEGVRNPVEMAVALQGSRDRVVAGKGAERLAREMGLPVFDAVVPRRWEEWVKQMRADRSLDQAAVSVSEEEDRRSGTVGVVALDRGGRLAAATSTGGRGFERVGRVSDSATVAGNYATATAAVSCTGIGEDITDEALAVRVVLGAESKTLEEAFEEAIEKANRRQRRLAAIGVSARGELSWGQTTEVLLAVGRGPGALRWAF